MSNSIDRVYSCGCITDTNNKIKRACVTHRILPSNLGGAYVDIPVEAWKRASVTFYGREQELSRHQKHFAALVVMDYLAKTNNDAVRMKQALLRLKVRIAYIGTPQEPHRDRGDGVMVPDWTGECEALEAALRPAEQGGA